MLEYNESLTIGDIMRFIATDHERTCILQSKNGKLYGVLSQGELITPISNVINPNPITISSENKNPEKDALKLFAKHGILLIPIIDSDRKIIRLISIRKIISDEYGS